MIGNCSDTSEFNARSLPEEYIASGFVLNTQFKQILVHGHSRILGPRGSGKTTLFKMLCPEVYAVCSKHLIEDIYPNGLPFWGIIISTDIQWSSLVDIIIKSNELSEEHKNLAYDILICISVIASIIDCFNNLLQITRKRISEGNPDGETLNIEQVETLEHSLSIELKGYLNLEKVIPTLSHIKRGIETRMRQLGIEIRTKTFSCESTLKCYINPLQTANLLFETFRDYCKNLVFCKRANFRWALCFDELEIAPEVVKSKIEMFLRGNSYQDKIFIKYGEAPFAKYNSVSNIDVCARPMDGHDYNTIYGWVLDDTSRDDWYRFCEKLYSKSLGIDVDRSSLLERFENGDEFLKIIKSHYVTNSNIYDSGDITEIRRLAIEAFKEKDELFSQYYSKTIQFSQERNQDGYAIDDIELFRYYYYNNEAPLYYGFPIICNISEGNPRLAITIMNRLKESQEMPISKVDQSRVLTEMSDHKYNFFGNYHNASCEVTHPTNKSRKRISLKNLLDWIGDYMKARLYNTKEFNPNSLVFFTVDEQHPIVSQLINLVNLGLQLGALIKFESSETGEPFYKLAYCLYPHYKLPICQCDAKEKLSSIIPENYYLDKDDPINNQLSMSFDYED